MSELFESSIATVTALGVQLRGCPLNSMVANGTSFAASLLIAWSGKSDTRSEQIVNALLVAWVDCGLKPPSTIAARLAASCGSPMTSCLTAGLSCHGDYHAPATECAKMILRAEEFGAINTVDEYISQGKRVPGLGHPIWRNDGRSEAIFASCGGEDGKYVKLINKIAEEVRQSTCSDLPVNMAGVTAALVLDIGLSPQYADAIFLIGRSVGLCAHIVEEYQDKRKCKIWQQ